MNQKNKSRNNAKAGKRPAKIDRGLAALRPAFPGQVVKQFTCEGTPVLLTTTVTTGVIAQQYVVQAGQITNFATRFGALFEEYRIVHCKIKLKNFSSTNPGLFTHWFDEKDANAPTAAEALQKSKFQFSCASPSPHTMNWTARDPLDLQYISIGTTNTTVVSYKIYTDTATYGSSAVATPYAQITSEFTVQFRGYN